MSTGVIYKIERFAHTDGHGIRTVVFLKGCPLHCQWCSSPESQKLTPEMAYQDKKCVLCGRCVPVCPNEAISISAAGLKTDRTLCTNCGKCEDPCLNHARQIVGYEIEAEDLVDEVMKDSIIFSHSGGGITMSGGEISLQPQFVKEVLQGCLTYGISTAIETCAYCNWADLEGILEYTGRAYIDIKCMSSLKHRQLTGVSNEFILENIKKASGIEDLELILRMPVIPGINDQDIELEMLGDFAAGLKNLKRLELLPYHVYGLYMYRAIDKEYALPEVKTPDAEYMNRARAKISNRGFEVQIDG